MQINKTFKQKVFEIVKKIPKGKTLTYKQVAIAAGNSNGARAVGNIMAKNTDMDIPCHRVIKSDGTLGGYNGLRGEKEKLLKKEKAL